MIKNILILALFFSQFSYAKINTIVSVLPQVTFVKKIGGDKVDIKLMVKPGNSPHSYEPKPSQMKDISKANMYFAIGVEFEEIWLDKFINQNKNMKIIHIDKNIKKLPIMTHEENHHKEHEHEGMDPHIWTSPKNVKVIAKNIYDALINVDKQNQEYYAKKLEIFLEEIEETDKNIKSILENYRGSKFMVFHPSWGYFAQEYSLKQISIEIEGKEPKPKGLISIIKEAKKEEVKAIFIQPEFSDKIAKTLAEQLKINIIKASPLSEDWSINLINLAKAIK